MLDPGSQLPLAEPAAGAVRLTRRRLALVALAFGFVLWGAAVSPAGDMLVGQEELARTIAIENLSVQGERVAGVIVNLSGRPVRDIVLRVVFSWLWADEHRQGTDDPSFATVEMIPDQVPPRGQTTFGYMYPRANVFRSDGRFLVDARVIGYRAVNEMRAPQY